MCPVCAHVNLTWPKDFDQPSDQMFHHALEQLVKNVWHDQQKNVSQWEPFPEWIADGLEFSFMAHMVKLTSIGIGQNVCLDCHSLYTTRKHLVFAKLVAWNFTFRAPATICTGHKGLLRIVPNKVGKDRMASPPDAVAAHHGDAGFTIIADRVQYISHTSME